MVRISTPNRGRAGDPVLWQVAVRHHPVDRHRVELVARPDEGGFRESSSSWWHRVWRHERTLLDRPGGACIVRDDVEIEPRLGETDPIIEFAVSQMFRRRHKCLCRRFG